MNLTKLDRLKKNLLTISIFYLLIICQLFSEEITFLVSSDTHYGYSMWDNNEAVNKAAIDDMNSLPGQFYPISELGEIDEPRGILVCGDLTGSGNWYDWSGFWLGKFYQGFDQDYEVNGKGRIKCPVYEGFGNHDISQGRISVLSGIFMRNNQRNTPVRVSQEGLHYSWDWSDIHFINLNLYPGETEDSLFSLDFLKTELQELEKTRPIILYFHYDFRSNQRWWTKQEKKILYKVIRNHNVIAIITGHTHKSRHYIWKGFNVFNAPSVMENGVYFVCNIKNNVITMIERSKDGWGKVWTEPY